MFFTRQNAAVRNNSLFAATAAEHAMIACDAWLQISCLSAQPQKHL
jgi:hypothetical protein